MKFKQIRKVQPSDDYYTGRSPLASDQISLIPSTDSHKLHNMFFSTCKCLIKEYEDFLTPSELLPIERIRELASISFNSENREHTDMVKSLWKIAFPDEDVPSIPSNDWKRLGFQGENPYSDFRGHGYLALKCIDYFSKNYPEEYKKIISHAPDYTFLASSTNICSIILYHFNIITSVKLCPCCGTEIMNRKKVPVKEMVNLATLMNKDYDDIAFYQLYSIGILLMDHDYLMCIHSKPGFNLLNFRSILLETRLQLSVIMRTKRYDVDDLYHASEQFLN